VPGLRREELAVLAGVSPDYYSRLEQGRQATVSSEVLDALARALRLDDVERAHLHDLAAPAPHRAAPVEVTQRPDPGLLRLMSTLDHVPVILLGHRGDVLASNALLRAVLGRPLVAGTSFTRYLFLDALARERIVNWADFASAAVAALRREAGRRPHDGRLADLIDELRGVDRDVARWWDDHAVRDYASVAKRIRHPDVGDLSFDIETVSPPQEPDQRLIVYTAQPDSPTARLLPILGSWNARTAPAQP
jgi:transcriptional regulator with XRE-family HTH domain